VRLGSNDALKVDVRLISATNKNVDEMVADKQFREDLYYRIKGVVIHLPPLRERREDIPLLIHFFLQQMSAKYHREIEGIHPDAQQVLLSHSWPGNVRELRMVLEQMVVMSNGPVLGVENLPQGIRPSNASPSGELKNLAGMSIEQVEKEHIRSTLELTQGNREQAAKILGIGERTLYRKIKEYGIQ
jgi:two-component system response regulator HydG